MPVCLCLTLVLAKGSKCGPHPQTLIMDATGLSFQRQLDFWRDIDLTDTPDVKVAEGK